MGSVFNPGEVLTRVQAMQTTGGENAPLNTTASADSIDSPALAGIAVPTPNNSQQSTQAGNEGSAAAATTVTAIPDQTHADPSKPDEPAAVPFMRTQIKALETDIREKYQPVYNLIEDWGGVETVEPVAKALLGADFNATNAFEAIVETVGEKRATELGWAIYDLNKAAFAKAVMQDDPGYREFLDWKANGGRVQQSAQQPISAPINFDEDDLTADDFEDLPNSVKAKLAEYEQEFRRIRERDEADQRRKADEQWQRDEQFAFQEEIRLNNDRWAVVDRVLQPVKLHVNETIHAQEVTDLKAAILYAFNAGDGYRAFEDGKRAYFEGDKIAARNSFRTADRILEQITREKLANATARLGVQRTEVEQKLGASGRRVEIVGAGVAPGPAPNQASPAHRPFGGTAERYAEVKASERFTSR